MVLPASRQRSVKVVPLLAANDSVVNCLLVAHCDSQAHHELSDVYGFAVENSLKPVEKGPLFPQALALISPSDDCVSFATR